jgi:hypothetical protein
MNWVRLEKPACPEEYLDGVLKKKPSKRWAFLRVKTTIRLLRPLFRLPHP